LSLGGPNEKQWNDIAELLFEKRATWQNVGHVFCNYQGCIFAIKKISATCGGNFVSATLLLFHFAFETLQKTCLTYCHVARHENNFVSASAWK
jgi:hypothetical protein